MPVTPIHVKDDETDVTTFVLGGSISILADDGRSLVHVRQLDDGSLEISTGLACVKHNGVILDSALAVMPKGNGTVVIARLPYHG